MRTARLPTIGDHQMSIPVGGPQVNKFEQVSNSTPASDILWPSAWG